MRASGQVSSTRIAQQTALLNWAGCVGRLRPASFITQFPWTSSGAEHSVYRWNRSRVLKATHPSSYGHSPYGLGYVSTPLEYVNRLLWQNAIFGDDIHIEAVTLDDEGHVQVIHSQPWITTSSEPPSALFKEEIDQYFAHFGFMAVASNPDAPLYYNLQMGLIVADAHEHNVLRDVFGTIVPIDIVIGVPGPDLLREILRTMP